MANTRSPNYPVISFPEAIKKARMIWDEEHHGKMPQEVAVKHMGYNTLNGASMGVLSALRKFGLLEGDGTALKLSADAHSILHDPPESLSRKEAVHRAAFRPILFKEIHEEFGDHVSEGNLRAYLLKRGFIPSAAASANRAYRETMALVAQEGRDYNGQEESPEIPTGESMEAPATRDRVLPAPPLAAPPPPASGGVLLLQVPFRGGVSLSVRIETNGQVLTQEHVARVRSYLKLAEEDLDSGENPTKATTEEEE